MNQHTQLENRLNRLEQQVQDQQRSLRRSRIACTILGGLLLGTMMIAATAIRPIENIIQAHRFEVLDSQNRLVAAIDANELGGQFNLWTNEGRNIFRATTNEAGGDMTIWNTHGTAVYGAYATESGSEAAHWNADGRPTSVIASDRAGGHVKLLSDRNQAAVELTSAAHGGQIALRNQGGSSIMAAGAGEEHGSGYMRLFNDTGDRVMAMGGKPDGTGRFDLYAESGNAVFSVDAQHGVGSVMAMQNTKGTKMFVFATREHGGLMNVLNSYGVPILVAGYSPEGRGGAVSINNARGIQILHAGVEETEGGSVYIWDADGKRQRRLGPAE